MNIIIDTYQFIQDLKALPFIQEIWLFGSRSRGDATERSDIDLAIICPTATQDQWYQVLEIQNNADTLLKIDCVRFDQLDMHDPLRANILRDKKVIYKKREPMTEPIKEIFWKDYFNNLGQAIKRLSEVIRHPDIDKNEFMQDASIQRFEFVIELFWKVLKKILIYEKVDVTTPRDTLNKAYQFKLINNEEIWLKMLDDRNNTSHVYKQADAKRIFEHIKTYLPVFESNYEKLKDKYNL